MNPIQISDVNNALRLLSEASAQCQCDLDAYAAEPDLDKSDKENDSTCPFYDQVYIICGLAAICKMTNLNPVQIHNLWNDRSGYVNNLYNIGRGRKSAVSVKDALYNINGSKEWR